MYARSQWLTNERSWKKYSKLTTLIRTWIKAFKKPKPHFLTGPCKREITTVSKKCQSSNRTQDSTFSGTIFRQTLKIPSLSGWVLPSISTKTFFISSRHFRELSILSNLERMTENLSSKGGSEEELAALMSTRRDLLTRVNPVASLVTSENWRPCRTGHENIGTYCVLR